MTHTKSILLVVLNVFFGIGIEAEVLPLRFNSEAPQSGNSPDTLSPTRQQWVRQSPLPTGRNLTGVSWATATHGLASGEALTLVETFDGGVTWREVVLGSQSSGSPFYNVLCKDSQNYFVIGNSATTGRDIFRSTNSGTAWQRITQFRWVARGITSILYLRRSASWVQTARP
jgi:Photosynthesis system II assembly factor YCF48